MRPRLKDHHLPKGVYLRRGVYYRVVRNVWLRLGTSPDCLTMPEAEVLARLPMEQQRLLDFTRNVITRARNNAKGRRGIECTLTRDDAVELLTKSAWACAVTGVRFTLEAVSGKRPYAPSVDRIDSSKGYTVENCRIVCVAANYAMNVWGEQVLRKMLTTAKRTGVLAG